MTEIRSVTQLSVFWENPSLHIMTWLNIQLAFPTTMGTHMAPGTNYIWKRGLSVFWKWMFIFRPGLVCSTAMKRRPLQMTRNMFIFPEAQQNRLWNLHVQVLLIRKLPLGQRRFFYAGSETSIPTGLRWLREHMRGAEGDHLQAFEDSSGPSTIATLLKGEEDHFWSIKEILSLSKTSRKM